MKIMKQLIYMFGLTFVLCISAVQNVSAQETLPVSNSQAFEQDQKDDNELRNVMFIILIVWLGLGLYLFLIDRKISKLEKELSGYEK